MFCFFSGQEKLKSSGVLVVGCGGLGCPAAQYLAGCGIGRIGLVDYDNVEINNLHRQLLHTEANVGLSKVKSAAQALQRLNSGVVVTEHDQQLDSLNALELVKCYDVVIDASDNVPTRYLVNDACVLSGVPLVSGSAVQLEGQLTVYNYKGGPCYRCLFPKPPPPQAVTNCGDAGVLGPVPGVIGVLEALQAVHMLLGNEEGVLSSRLVLFDGSASLFRTIRLRTRRSDCPVCGDNPTVTSLCDYEQFCGIPANDKGCGVKLLCSEDRVTAEELCCRLDGGVSRMVVDVRSPQEFEMCRLPGSINVPLPQIGDARHNSQFKAAVQQAITSDPNLTVLCRRGNDSQLAVAELKKMFPEFSDRFKDLQGGLHSWAKNVDNSFPVY
ncbi:hypothetical protein AAG570_014085 [Ranatra chinensis]|uniref:Adenylyltransferase and sulfurtransferase MOCS3 homolog n=1 Tax=Ranatra chinensis TaxID=642074 RepID=A0ABD0XS21_9HEMI